MLMKEKLKKQINIERGKLTTEEGEGKSDYAIWKGDKKRISKAARGLASNSNTPVYDIDYKDFRKVMEEYNF